jgi:sigma-B regulation protein RsbU (phosphoserine phosphatase)
VKLRTLVESVYGGTPPKLPGLDVGRSYLGTAHDFAFGGDLVDVFAHGAGSTALAVVDITGHGVSAAMHAGLIKYALRAYFSQGLTAVQAVRALNHLCIEDSAFDGTEDLFAAVFVGVIDRDHRTLTYVSAGHRTAYVIEPFKVTTLESCSPIIGLLDDEREFSSRMVTLSAGDIIAIVTDGFSEARNPKGDFLGSKALADVIVADREQHAQTLAQAITQRAYDYAQQDNHDDVGVLVVKIVNAESHEGASNGVAYPSSNIPGPVVNTAAGSNGRPGPRAQKVQSEAFDSTPSARIGSS